MTTRRTVLAGLTTLLAGCSTTDDQPTSTPTEAPTATPTETATPTATAEPTPSDADRLDELLATIDTELDASISAYSEFAGTMNTTWLDVDATTSDFESLPVRSAYNDGRTALDDADAVLADAPDDVASEYQPVVDAYRHLYEFVATAARVQERLASVATTFEAVLEPLSDREQLASSELGRLDDLDRTTARAQAFRDNFTATPGAVETADTIAFSADDYTAKLAQIDTELAYFGGLKNALGSFEEGVEMLADGVDEYANGNDTKASSRLWTASQRLDDVQGALNRLNQPPSVSGLHDDLACYVSATADGASHLYESADAGGEQEHEDAAIDAFESCDLVADSSLAVSPHLSG